MGVSSDYLNMFNRAQIGHWLLGSGRFLGCGRKALCLGILALLPITEGLAQGQQQPILETPRQALLEMLSRGGPAVAEHLTVESLQSLKETGELGDLSRFNIPEVWPALFLRTFEAGPVLASYEIPGRETKKFEIHVDREDVNGAEASIELSFHQVDAPDKNWELPSAARYVIALERQNQVWRLNMISISVDFPVRDPAFLKTILGKDREGSKTAIQQQIAETPEEFTNQQMFGRRPEDLLFGIAQAEEDFARMHPQIGFTCSLPDLVASSGAFGSVKLDPKIASGEIRGYRFLLAGCTGKPSGSFQAIAEPLEGKSHEAFCTDATRNLRFAEDGRGATCISTGKNWPPLS
jgi:hypothetical protein